MASSSASTQLVAAARYAVAARLVSVGEYVKEGTPLFKLVADDPIKYRATLPERFIADVKVGQNVQVSVAAYPQPFIGKIARISPQVDPVSRRLQIEVLVPNPQGKLQSGGFATGLVQTSMEKQVTFVPQEAIVSFAGVQKVFTVKDGKAVERAIETGTRQGDYFEVVKGLTGVEPVVINGASKLADGMPVTVKATQSADKSATQPASARLPE
jgi:RND family efflux transporter MFP subunit